MIERVILGILVELVSEVTVPRREGVLVRRGLDVTWRRETPPIFLI